MLIVGLTGSIGMGKSTTARIFRDLGVPVHDSDSAVHELYRGEAAPLVAQAFPGVVSDGVVDRKALAARVLDDAAAMRRLEAIVHPLVGAHREAFLARARAAGAPLAVLDIPLLFEIGATGDVDVILVVSAAAATQRARVLARPGMSEEKFAAILARQTPDEVKRRRAHYIIDTGHGLASARAQVRDFLAALAGRG